MATSDGAASSRGWRLHRILEDVEMTLLALGI
jgi:hypothetical protein